MPHRTLRGRIIYTSTKPERLGQVRGRENFTLTRQQDGARVMHAHCEIDDAPNVIRDVVLATDADGWPLDCSLRLTVGDRYEGTGLISFGEHQGRHFAECHTVNRRDGSIRQRLNLDERVRWLGAHPICGDALALRCYPLAQGPGRQFFPQMMLTSPDHRGATGPMMFRLGFGLEFVGTEAVEVVAGRFNALHFRYVDTAGQLPEEHPVYNLWCTADDDYVFLKGEVGGYMKTHYELTELTELSAG